MLDYGYVSVPSQTAPWRDRKGSSHYLPQYYCAEDETQDHKRVFQIE